jgi:peptide deformylase
VEKFDQELQTLVADMFESMYAANGVGLAAPQIGVCRRLTVIDVSNGKNPEARIVCANPEIIHSEGEQREEEGCLSLPGFRGHVLRPQFVTVRARGRIAGPCLLSRDRSSQWGPFSRALEPAEAGPHQKKNP